MPTFIRPYELQRLQFDELRSHNTYEVAPWLVGPAVSRQVEDVAPPVAYLPAAIGYNKWKRNWGDPSYAPSARQFATLPEYYEPRQPYEPIAFNRMHQEAAQYNHTPMNVYDMDEAPLARNVLYRDQLVDAPTLTQIAKHLNNYVENFDAEVATDARGYPASYVFTKR